MRTHPLRPSRRLKAIYRIVVFAVMVAYLLGGGRPTSDTVPSAQRRYVVVGALRPDTYDTLRPPGTLAFDRGQLATHVEENAPVPTAA
jgi:hypothetical protein